MRNAYEYIDPDYAYTDPDTGVLRNLANIAVPNDLLFFESAAVVKRTKELEAQPIIIRGAETLLDIHRYLFQDVYHWEGNGRAQREFIRILALEKGYVLNLNPPDNLDVYERYMAGTIDGDIEKLTALILGLLLKGSINPQ